MEAYIERMVEEKRELDEKIAKLIAFRYSEKGDEILDDRQRSLMDRQFRAMTEYRDTLGVRIYTEKVKTGIITPPSPLKQDGGECCAAVRPCY